MYRDATRRLAEDGDILRIASERSDIPLHPLERGDLVHIGIVALDLFRKLTAQRGECEEPQAPQTVVEGDQDYTLLGEVVPRKVRLGAAAEYEGAAVDPHHHRQLCPRRGRRWSPDTEKQAIFRRGSRDPRRPTWKGSLRTIRAELARITLTLPLGHGL